MSYIQCNETWLCEMHWKIESILGLTHVYLNQARPTRESGQVDSERIRNLVVRTALQFLLTTIILLFSIL